MKMHKKWLTQQQLRDFVIVSDLIANCESEANRLNADWFVNKNHTRITIESETFITIMHVKRLSVGLSFYYNVVKVYHYIGGEV